MARLNPNSEARGIWHVLYATMALGVLSSVASSQASSPTFPGRSAFDSDHIEVARRQLEAVMDSLPKSFRIDSLGRVRWSASSIPESECSMLLARGATPPSSEAVFVYERRVVRMGIDGRSASEFGVFALDQGLRHTYQDPPRGSYLRVWERHDLSWRVVAACVDIGRG